MKVSIITVCLNSSSTIDCAMQSVFKQNHEDIEYIIVDGGSSDGTLAILETHKNRISSFISEPDNGIYDAMNKGIALATGDIIGILNADDFYADSNVISTVASVFENDNFDCCYGDLEYVDFHDTNKMVRRWTSQVFTQGLFRKGFHPPHPTFFARKKLYDKYGYYDTTLSISADYELMLRFFEKNEVRSEYIPNVLVKMRSGGVSNKNFFQILKANIQCCKAWAKNDLKVSPLTILRKPLSKISQLTYAKN